MFSYLPKWDFFFFPYGEAQGPYHTLSFALWSREIHWIPLGLSFLKGNILLEVGRIYYQVKRKAFSFSMPASILWTYFWSQQSATFISEKFLHSSALIVCATLLYQKCCSYVYYSHLATRVLATNSVHKNCISLESFNMKRKVLAAYTPQL